MHRTSRARGVHEQHRGAAPETAKPITMDGLRGDLGGLGRNRTTDTRIFNPLLYQLSYQAARGGTIAACSPQTAGFAAKQRGCKTGWHPFFSDVSSAISVEVVAAVPVRKNRHQRVTHSTTNDARRPRKTHAAGGQDGQVAFGQQPLAVGHGHGEQGVRRADVAELDQGHVGVVLGHLDAF